MKQKRVRLVLNTTSSAAFGRLCVETKIAIVSGAETQVSAAFGRLCVETYPLNLMRINRQSAAFGRLCVETDV